jgi:hypothetical protein
MEGQLLAGGDVAERLADTIRRNAPAEDRDLGTALVERLHELRADLSKPAGDDHNLVLDRKQWISHPRIFPVAPRRLRAGAAALLFRLGEPRRMPGDIGWRSLTAGV